MIEATKSSLHHFISFELINTKTKQKERRDSFTSMQFYEGDLESN